MSIFASGSAALDLPVLNYFRYITVYLKRFFEVMFYKITKISEDGRVRN